MINSKCKLLNPHRRCWFSKPGSARLGNRIAEATLPVGSRHHSGFTLVEILLAVSLLGTFSLLAFRLLGANMDLNLATLNADSNTARFDRAVRMLRIDVADSTSIEMPARDTVRIHSGDTTVEWNIAGNSLSRAASSHQSTWDVGQPVNLKLDGAVVLLTVNQSDQIAMAPLPKGTLR